MCSIEHGRFSLKLDENYMPYTTYFNIFHLIHLRCSIHSNGLHTQDSVHADNKQPYLLEKVKERDCNLLT